VIALAMERPTPPAGGGLWQAVIEEPRWTVLPADTSRACRWGSPARGYCRRPAVATLRRGRAPAPWAYCERHLYGRWIEGDQVMTWRRLR
jgi:hypothetical protein